MTRALLQQALEALMLTQDGSELSVYIPDEFSWAAAKEYDKIINTITDIREYLAQPEQEPVAWVCLFQGVLQDDFIFHTEDEATKYMRKYAPEDQQEMWVNPIYLKDTR